MPAFAMALAGRPFCASFMRGGCGSLQASAATSTQQRALEPMALRIALRHNML